MYASITYTSYCLYIIHMPFVFNIYLGRLCDKNKIAIKYTKDFKTFLKAINYYMYVVKTTSKQILFN